jgi:Ca2+-binding EF-hand superfamily protein
MAELNDNSKTRRNLTLKKAARQLTFRRAALVSISSISQSMKATLTVKQYTIISRQLLDLQIACLGAETEFFRAVSQLGRKDNQFILMKLMDKDGDGKINLRELAFAFQKMDPTKAYAQSVEDANASIQKADKDGDGMLNEEEFGYFIDELMDSMQCTFDDLCFIVIQWLAFNDTGHDIIEEALEDNEVNASQNDTQNDDLEDEVTETRIAILFQYLDYSGNGKVLFLDVFRHLFEIIKTMDPRSRDVLFMMDNAQTQSLTYHQFTNLLFNVTAACPSGTHFHDIADAITVAGASPDRVHGVELMSMLSAVEIDKAFKDGFPSELLDEMTPLTYGRIRKLFRMSDANGDGFVEAQDLVLSVRKLHGTTPDINETIEQMIAGIAHMDKDDDQRLNLEEYGAFISMLASSLDVDVNELVSYLAVELARRDYGEGEKVYFDKIRKQAIRKVKAKPQGTQSTAERQWSWLNGIAKAER